MTSIVVIIYIVITIISAVLGVEEEIPRRDIAKGTKRSVDEEMPSPIESATSKPPLPPIIPPQSQAESSTSPKVAGEQNISTADYSPTDRARLPNSLQKKLHLRRILPKPELESLHWSPEYLSQFRSAQGSGSGGANIVAEVKKLVESSELATRRDTFSGLSSHSAHGSSMAGSSASQRAPSHISLLSKPPKLSESKATTSERPSIASTPPKLAASWATKRRIFPFSLPPESTRSEPTSSIVPPADSRILFPESTNIAGQRPPPLIVSSSDTQLQTQSSALPTTLASTSLGTSIHSQSFLEYLRNIQGVRMEEPPISTGEKSIKVKPDKSKKGGRRRKSSLPRKLSQVKIESRKLAGKELKEQTPITLSSSSSESVEHNRRDQEYEPPTAIIDMEPAEVEVELSKRTSDINDAKDDVTTKNNELAESKSKRSKQKALVKSIGAKRTHVSKVKNSPKIKVIPSSRTAAHKEKSLIELDQTTSDSSSNESIRLLHSTQRRKTQKYDDEAIRTSKHKKEKMDKTKKRKWRDWRDELKRDGKKRPKIHKGKTFDIEEADKRARKMKRKIKDESRKHPKEDELSHKKGYKTKTHHLEKGESSRKRKTHLNHRYEHKEKLSIDLEKEQVREVATEEKLPIDLGKDQGRELVTEEKLPTDLENKHEKEVVKEHVPQSIIDLNVPFYDFMDVNIENVGQKDDNENFETPMPHEEMRRSPSAALESIIMSSSSPEHHPLGLTLSLSHTPPPRPTPPSINQPEQFIKSRKHVKSREDKKVKTIRNKKQFASVSSDEEMKFSASKLKKHNHRRVHHKEKYSSPPLADSSSGTKNESEQNERKRRRREKKMKNISRISRRESERSGHEKLKDVDRTDRLRTEKSDQRKKTKYSDRSSRQKVEKSVQKNKHSSDQKKKSTRRDIIPHRPKPAAISEGDESSESMNGVVQAYASKKLKKAKEEEKLPSVKKTAKNVDSAKSVDAEVRAKKGAKDKKEKGHHVDHKKTKALDKRIDKSSKSVGHIDVPSDFSTSVDTIDTFSSSEKESSQEVKKETKKKATSKTKGEQKKDKLSWTGSRRGKQVEHVELPSEESELSTSMETFSYSDQGKGIKESKKKEKAKKDGVKRRSKRTQTIQFKPTDELPSEWEEQSTSMKSTSSSSSSDTMELMSRDSPDKRKRRDKAKGKRPMEEATSDSDSDKDDDDSSSTEEYGSEYIVEGVVDKQFSKKTHQPEYKIRWKGFGPIGDTWEPAEGVKHLQLVKQYEKNRRRDRRPKPSAAAKIEDSRSKKIKDGVTSSDDGNKGDEKDETKSIDEGKGEENNDGNPSENEERAAIGEKYQGEQQKEDNDPEEKKD